MLGPHAGGDRISRFVTITVRIDSGAASDVDMYSPTATYQPVVYTSTGLADAVHTLTITSTGRKNAGSSAARVVVDAIDVITPGRRHLQAGRQRTCWGQLSFRPDL